MTKIFTCNLCNKEFSRKQSLQRHLKKKFPCVKKEEVEEEEEVEEKKIKCEFCDKSYKQKQHLTRHLKTCKVKQEMKFKCDFCKSGFTNDFSLKRHLKKCKVKKEQEKPTIKELELEIKLAKITFKSLKLEEEMKLMKSQIEENSKIIKFFMEDFIIRRGGNSSQI